MESLDTSCDFELAHRLNRDGFAIVRRAITDDQVETLKQLCRSLADAPSISRRKNSVYGLRNLLSCSDEMRQLANASPYHDLAASVMGRSARAVYGVFFDKTLEANWPVPWHQDVTIHVRENRDVPGFEARTHKDGAVHMLPPVEISEQMLAIRIHLDEASSSHGALRVIPESHRLGRLSNEALEKRIASRPSVNCDVQAGDVMLMRPLLVHASSACTNPGHRRVIHIEYAPFDLPDGLEWHG